MGAGKRQQAIVRCAGRCGRRAGRRLGGARTGCGSGRLSDGVPVPRMRAARPACRPRSGPAGFARLAGWLRISRRRCPAVTCPSPSGRTSRSGTRSRRACARSPAGWAARRPRSRVSCGVTRPRARGGWTTAPRRRSGMPSGGHAVPRSRNWPQTSGCASTCRTGLAARSPGRTACPCRARTSAGPAGGTGRVPTGGGPGRGARSRSRTGSAPTSPMMRPWSVARGDLPGPVRPGPRGAAP